MVGRKVGVIQSLHVLLYFGIHEVRGWVGKKVIREIRCFFSGGKLQQLFVCGLENF